MRTQISLPQAGTLSQLVRTHDWTYTPLGPVEEWPQPLATLVEVILCSVHPMFVVWGQEHTLVYNDGLVPVLGSKHPWALGSHYLEVWHEIREDLSPLVERVFQGEPIHLENFPFILERKGYKEQATFSFSFTPITGINGNVDGFFCVFSETTGQVRAERQLRDLNATLEHQVVKRTEERDRLWRNTQDMQVVIDGQGIFKAINPAFTTILGWLPEDVLGKTVFDFIIPDEDATQGALEHARNENLQTFVNCYRHKDGGFRWFSWVATPEAELIYASGRHITAEKEQAKALAAAEEALRHSQKMEAIGQLTGGLAHDFNNLLAGISGSLELMQIRMQQGRITDVERYMSTAQGAVRRAAALTHRLLAFARRQTLSPSPTDVNKLIQGMEELIQRTVGPMIQVEVVGSSGAWPALVDPPQLENALLNLCLNARDAMPKGGRITIETANKWIDTKASQQHNLPEGQYLSLCVSDTGIGMTPEVIAHAFEPFFTTKPIGEGTGLGLSMIYGFAQQSGGQVRIYSEVDQGSTVCIYLPRYYGEAAVDPATNRSPTLEPVRHDKTVLVVDDEPTVRMLVTDILEEQGFATLEANDSAAGLKILQSVARIDLLVTDVGLPGGMNGRQMADAGRALRPELKVLFITGYAENTILGNGMLEPGMAVVTKPFSLEAIQARIHAILNV